MKQYVILFMSFILTVGACAPKGPVTLTVMTHDSFAVSEEVVRSFEQANNIKVTFLASGDTGAALNKAILTKDAPLADLFFGVDNTFMSRALEAEIFEPYRPQALEIIPTNFQLDPTSNLIPVDYGDVCINYDKAYFSENNLSVPETFEDLLKPEYFGLLAVENPATSSPGLAFLLASIAHFGDPDYLKYWGQLRDNGLIVVSDWETAYYTNFSASSGRGPQPMVVSYGSSPPAEVIFSETPLDDAPTASIIGPDTCFRQIEFVGILKGTEQRDLAEKFIDFMLAEDFQADLPLQMFVFPVNPDVDLPDVFIQYAQIPDQPALLDPADIAANRERWINDWTDVVIR
ncbi:MAG: thiamine ABC transporter substrate-binding protein [Anaerolineae bacterium]|nr:thiamine ABC transporter substrate-binding protein [Anaerolineae bacterium]